MELEFLIKELSEYTSLEVKKMTSKAAMVILQLLKELHKLGVENPGQIFGLMKTVVFAADGNLSDEEIDCVNYIAENSKGVIKKQEPSKYRKTFEDYLKLKPADILIQKIINFMNQIVDDYSKSLNLNKAQYEIEIKKFFIGLAIVDGPINKQEETLLKFLFENK